MAEKKKEVESNDQKVFNYREIINKPEFKQLVQEGMLRLVHNRPKEPMLFLAEYFESQSSSTKLDKHLRTLNVLQLTPYFQPNFQSNLLKAYEIISEPKPIGKKPLHNKPGLTGNVYEELLSMICSSKFSKSIYTVLLKKIGCKPHEMVPFNVFKYGVTCCFVSIEFFNLCENLYVTLSCGKTSELARRDVCETVILKFQKTLTLAETNSNLTKAAAMLEASYRLRPDILASDLLETQSHNGETMNKDEFLRKLFDIFQENIKPIT